MSYNRPVPIYGDMMTVEDFKKAVESGLLIDYDGSGYPVKDNLYDNDIIVRPSKVDDIPKDATQILWFNR